MSQTRSVATAPGADPSRSENQRRLDPSTRDGTRGIDRLARFISTITFAPVLSIPAFIAINALSASAGQLSRELALSLLFGAVLPILLTIAWGRIARQELDFPVRATRTRLLTTVAAIYMAGTVSLVSSGASHWSIQLMAAYAVVTGAVALASLRWKVSVHAVGVVTPTVILVLALGWPWLVYVCLLPIVAWSRIHLGRHTILEIAQGAIIGVLGAAGILLSAILLGIAV